MAKKKHKKKTADDQKVDADHKITSILPHDVIENILLRLTIKSLFRFKTVCKSWQAIICNHRFSKNYSIQKSKSKNVFLIKRPPSWGGPIGGSFSLIKCWENNKFTESNLGNPLGNYIPLCSCNGIVLLKTSSNTYNAYRLWNPTIGRYTPMFLCPYTPDGFEFKCGLFHDSRTDDYKVVIISPTHYTVFSCKSGTWSEKKPLPRSGPETCAGVFVDGSFYWWLRNGQEIVCFDVRDEEVRKLQQPSDLTTANETDNVGLRRLSGRLCLYRMAGNRTKLQLWVMENDGGWNCRWRELMNMETAEPRLRMYEPVCLTNEDNVVLRLKGSRFVVYYVRRKRFGRIWRFYGIYYCDLLLYSDSPLFPDHNIKPID